MRLILDSEKGDLRAEWIIDLRHEATGRCAPTSYCLIIAIPSDHWRIITCGSSNPSKTA